MTQAQRGDDGDDSQGARTHEQRFTHTRQLGHPTGKDGPEQVQHLLMWHYLATLGISITAGFLFSLYPAYQASKLDPVEALRYE